MERKLPNYRPNDKPKVDVKKHATVGVSWFGKWLRNIVKFYVRMFKAFGNSLRPHRWMYERVQCNITMDGKPHSYFNNASIINRTCEWSGKKEYQSQYLEGWKDGHKDESYTIKLTRNNDY